MRTVSCRKGRSSRKTPRIGREDRAANLGHLAGNFGSVRWPAVAIGAAFAVAPQTASATEVRFSDGSEFQSQLADIVATGSGNSSLTFDGSGTIVLNGTVVAPGSNTSLAINLAPSEAYIGKGAGNSGALTLGAGATLNFATDGGNGDVYVGQGGGTGTLTVNGGVANIAGSGSSPIALLIGYGGNGSGTLNITNGGVVNLGMESGATKYSQFFVGYQAGAQITMNNGTINLGAKGASMRIGLSGQTTLDMSNGSVIDSSRGASHFWVGESAASTATVNLTDSRITIRGGGTNSADDDRYFVIGRGGNGVFNQNGADSRVQVSGIALVGIGWGNDANGTYNLNDGVLEVGTATMASSFRVGVGTVGENSSTAVFNVNGGQALLHGNLEIANSGSSGKHPDATVNISGGLVKVDGKVNFGAGDGKLNLKGGVLEIGGANAITGSGAITATGGSIRAASNLTVQHAITLGTGGLTFDSNGHSITHNRVLSGTGGVAKTGSGTLVLSGANTFTGGVSVSGGTLETGSASALGAGTAPVTLDGGTLKLATLVDLSRGLTAGTAGGTVDLGTHSVTLGASGGAGGMTFNNGSVTLSGALGWAGQTTLGTGVSLTTAANGQLSSASTLNLASAATLNNGAFTQTLGGLSGSGSVSTGGELSVGANGASTTFDGVISGTGGLRKVGSGTLLLTGAHTYGGDTHVDAGHLTVNGSLASTVEVGASGSLGGSGTIGGLVAHGVVRPGNSIGTLDVEGDVDFRAGTTYEVEVNASGASDLIAATGTATLTGGTVSVLAEAGAYDARSTYTILTAAGGLQDTRFALVTTNMVFLTPTLLYGDTQVDLQLDRNSLGFGSIASTANQLATAGPVERFGFGNPLHDAVVYGTADQARFAFDALSGEIHASARTVLIEDSHFVREAVTDRLRSAFDGVAAAPVPVMAYAEGGPVMAPATTDRFAIWGQGFGAWGHTNSDGNAAHLDRSTGGFLAGADASVADSWRVGVLAGYSHSSFDAADRGASGTSNNYHLGLYGGTQWGKIGFRSGLAYSWSDIGTSRSVALSGYSDHLEADYSAGTFQAFGELAYQIETPVAALEPFANLAYVGLSTDGFIERGQEAALASQGQDSDTGFTTLGLRGSRSIDVGGTAAQVRGTIGWQHAFGDTTPLATHGFVGTDSFTVAGNPIAKDSAILEAGIDVGISPSATVGIAYQGKLASDAQQHGFTANLDVRF
jgi:fibronectin-binding autotransporter adhesin